MKDSVKLGVLIGLVYFFTIPTLWGFLAALDLGFVSVLLMYALAAIAFVIPVVLYIKGLRKAMKAYLLTLFIPVLAVMLLFGSCLLMFNI